jgi:hypothetical protein
VVKQRNHVAAFEMVVDRVIASEFQHTGFHVVSGTD